MLAFLSRLRLTGANDQPHDDGDDASSLNRSLNLPWPVTESSARRPSTSTLPVRTRDTPLAQAAHGTGATSLSNGLVISNPIPRSQTSSLTGFSEYHTASSGSVRSASPGPSNAYGRPPRAGQPQAVPWYEHERARKLLQRPGVQTSGGATQYAPPQVVRLDSEAFISTPRNEDGEDSPPPKYVARQDVTESQYLARGTPSVSAGPGQPSYTAHDDLEDDAEFYTSPFDSDPEEVTPTQARFTHSNTSSVTSLSQFPKPPVNTMPKSKWNLKLQLHGVKGVAAPATGTTDPSLRDTNQHISADVAQAPRVRTPGSSSLSGVDVDTDVYKNAYNYPLVPLLSPIPEQDYFSPTVESPGVRLGKSDHSNGSLRKPSPGNESLASLIIGSTKDVSEKEPPRLRNGAGRSGSGGSVATVNGSDITRPSPIYSSPFLTRQLNRTVSQSSSRSDSQSQQHTQPPTPITAQTPVQSHPSSGMRPILAMGMTHVSTAVPRATPTIASSIPSGLNLKDAVATPTSADTTATSATGGTIYHTPTSAVTAHQQTPTAPTPTAPAGASASPITPSLLAGANPATPTNVATPPITLTGPSDSSIQTVGGQQHQQQQPKGFPKIPSLPTIPPLDWRSSVFGSVAPRASREVRDRLSVADNARKGAQRMPTTHDRHEAGHDEEEGEEEGEDIEEDDFDDDDYDHESLHAASFVTADGNEYVEKGKGRDVEAGVEPSTANGASNQPQPTVSPKPSLTTESFIDRRWEKDAGLTSSPTTTKGNSARWPVRFSKPKSHPSPAFWTFWLGFIFPVLWLIGGWHFTNIGELPPRFTILEWYFWNSTWGFSACLQGLSYRLFGCCLRNKTPGAGHKLKKTHKKQGSEDSTGSTPSQAGPRQRPKGKRGSGSRAQMRVGQVYPALPRWVADKQSSDDGRMRLNDPKRSLRGISFGYPFIARPLNSQDSSHAAPSSSTLRKFFCSPNRVLDLLYGVKLQEVRGRPESGRRMFDPWIQRCRYALCYALIIVGAGLCTASVYLIAINTRKIES